MSTEERPSSPIDLESLRTISALDAGRLLGFGRSQVYKRIHGGTFPVPVRVIGKEFRVRVIDLRSYLDDDALIFSSHSEAS